ncbi:MAG: serine/threonine protein kinase [Roseibacillus sp.]
MNPEAFQAPSLEELAPLFPNYSIDAFVAQGGMGAVYLATQTSLERQVAIKILPREFGADEEFRKSFAAEAKAMAKLNHPNLIGVYDFGEVDGMPFIVMEYVAGKPLHDSAYGLQIDPSEAARIVLETCNGLHHAHEHDILHRDVKPANILMDPHHAEPKLGDFGLAMATTEDSDDGLIYGTPGYAAPEVYEGNPDARSDVYAAAVILYQLLTGQLPDNPYQHPSALANCDRRYDVLLAKALQPDPNDRHQTAAELATELEALRKAPASKVATASASTPHRPPTQLASAKKSSLGPVIGALAALLILGGGFFFLKSDEKKDQPEEPPIGTAEALPHEDPNAVANTPSEEEPTPPEVEPTPVKEPVQEMTEVITPEENEEPEELPEEESVAMVEKSDPIVPDTTIIPAQPVSTFDHLTFLKRGRDFCSEKGEKILTEYHEDLVKNIESLEREGKSILRDQEYLTRDDERARKENLEAAIEKYRQEGRLPTTLVSATPGAFTALSYFSSGEVVEKELREALAEQAEIDKELTKNLQPLAEVYANGVEKQAETLKGEGNDFDAGILLTEATKARDSSDYFLKIVKGEDPLPEGLNSDPAHMSADKLVVGEWKSESTDTLFIFHDNGTAEAKKPRKTGTWRVEGEQVVADWGGDKQDLVTLTSDDPNRILVKYKKGDLFYFDRTTPLVTEPVVGEWVFENPTNDIVFTFNSDKSVNNGKGNKNGQWQKTEDGYLITWNNGVAWKIEMEDSKTLLLSRHNGVTSRLVRK